MKRILFFCLGLLILGVVFSLGRLNAKTNGSWKCLYGNCEKEGFAVMKTQKDFFIGNVDGKTIQNGFFIKENEEGGHFYVQEKSFVKMSTDSIAFGQIGINNNQVFCIAKGYVFKLDLSSYDEYADEGCKPLESDK